MNKNLPKTLISKILIKLDLVIVLEMIKEAWVSIVSYKLRSILTILGIVIGIASVVLMVSIGQGAQQNIDREFSNLGSNLLVIMPGSPNFRGVRSGNFQTLTYTDAQDIANFNFINKVSYSKNSGSQAVYGNINKTVGIYGISPNYLETNNLKIAKGSNFNIKNARSASSFIIIGSNVALELYKNEDPIGKIIRVKNVAFKVIGVLQPKGSSFGSSEDDAVFISFPTFMQKISGSKYPRSVSQISVNVKDQLYIDYAQDKITQMLRKRHNLKPSQDDDFRIANLQEIANSIKSVTQTFSILLASIAAISLIVGSIGIVNMMLVSVSERTKEIGLRKALGAKENLIMQQFLIEALIISLLGSLIGLVLGLVLSQFAQLIIKIDLPISIYAVFLSIIISILVGVLSGLAPAIKASKLSPVEAFRFE